MMMRMFKSSFFMLLASFLLLCFVVNAEKCQDNQLKEMAKVFDQEENKFTKCFQDLKTSKDSAIDTLVSEEMLKDENIEKVCSQDSCIRALIVLMEALPDCCTAVERQNSLVNFPRLADDILHQCDVRDARLLSEELEKEVAKLPDLKVQIKSLSTSSSSQDNEGGMDVIIDVKKREIMKAQTPNVNDSSFYNSQTSNAGKSRMIVTHTFMTMMVMMMTMMVTLMF